MTRIGYYSMRNTIARDYAIEKLRISFGLTALHNPADVIDMALGFALQEAQPIWGKNETTHLPTLEKKGNPTSWLKHRVFTTQLDEREGRIAFSLGGMKRLEERATKPSRSRPKAVRHPMGGPVKATGTYRRGATSSTGSRGKRGTRPKQ